MAKIALIICFAACLLALLSGGRCIEVPDYIYIPGPGEGSSLLLSLKEIDVEPGSSPETVLKYLEKKGEASNMLENVLASLAFDNLECNYMQVFYVIRMVQILQSPTSKLHNRDSLLAYLERYASEKFKSCAPSALDDIRFTRDECLEEIQDAERLFKRIVSLPDDATDEQLYNKLKDFDMTMDEKLKPMAKLASLVGEQVLEDLDNACLGLRMNIGHQLDAVNLAASLNPGEDFYGNDMSLKKLKELNRNCMDFIRNRVD